MSTEQHPARPGASWWVPERLEPALVATGVHDCRGCELNPSRGSSAGDPRRLLGSARGGSGPVPAAVVLVGAHPARASAGPGVDEDPVERVLVAALQRAAVDLASVWTTHAVKHPAGTSSLDPAHVAACAPWWHAELEMVRPRGVVLLGERVAEALVGVDVAERLVPGTIGRWPRGVDRPVRRLDSCHHPRWVLLTRDPRSAVDEEGRPVPDEVDGLVRELAVAAAALSAGTELQTDRP